MSREVRFSKFQMARWMNGDEHWLIMGQHYEPHEAPEDIVKKLRNAAWYRGTTVAVTVYPDRIWIKAREPGQGTHRPDPSQGSLEDRVQALESELKALRSEVDEWMINNS